MADVRHETSDVDVRVLLRFVGGLLTAAVVIPAVVGLLFVYLARREARPVPLEFPLAGAEQHRMPPEPRLQTNPREDLQTFRDQEDTILTSYGWVDRNAGIVRIPIEEAMKLTVERGLPTRQEAAGSK
jgi:hypothetical protein